MESGEGNALPARLLAWISSLTLRRMTWEMLLRLEILAGFACFLVHDLSSLLPRVPASEGLGGLQRGSRRLAGRVPACPRAVTGVLCCRAHGDGLSPAGLVCASGTARWAGGRSHGSCHSHPLLWAAVELTQPLRLEQHLGTGAGEILPGSGGNGPGSLHRPLPGHAMEPEGEIPQRSAQNREIRSLVCGLKKKTTNK